MSTVNVRSIAALEELQGGLARYGDQARAALDAAQRETQRTLDWLDERVRHWRNEVARCQEQERRALAVYQRCLASGTRERPAYCGAEEQAVAEARRRLAAAQQEERMATQARQAVQAAADAYLREAGRLRVMLQSDTPKAVATLRHKVETLRSYAGGVNADNLAVGALAFGAGMAIGAALGGMRKQEEPGSDEAIGQPLVFAEGSEQPIRLLHPEIRNVQIGLIDLNESHVRGDEDFRKISHAEMVEGLNKLQQVQRWIEQGATDQMLWEIDQEQGLSGARGYHNIYRVFYGDNAITLEKVGQGYRVIDGYHRLAVARELGWTVIPARVVE